MKALQATVLELREERERGISVRESLLRAGAERLRPIFLTTVTTVLGLTPLMLEQSFQARFLIPMAISLGFGILFATVIILLRRSRSHPRIELTGLVCLHMRGDACLSQRAIHVPALSQQLPCQIALVPLPVLTLLTA